MNKKETVRGHIRPSTNKAVDSYQRTASKRKKQAANSTQRPPAPTVESTGVVTVEGGKIVNGTFIPNRNYSYHPPAPPPLDLSGQDLSGYDLSELDLRGANLEGANLAGANLSGADMRSALMKLAGANLEGANLNKASLSTLLKNVNLRRVSAAGTQISTTQFIDCDISDANFSTSTFSENVFEGVTAKNTSFTECNFNKNKIVNTLFTNAVFSKVELRDTKIEDTRIRNSVFQGVKVQNGWWADVKLENCDMEDSGFIMVGLGGASITNSSLKDVMMLDTKLNGVDFTDTDTRGLWFSPSGRPEGRMDWMPYPYYTLEDAQEVLGLDEDEFTVAVWSGEIEARKNKDLSVETSVFSSEKHHVPAWAIANIITKTEKAK